MRRAAAALGALAFLLLSPGCATARTPAHAPAASGLLPLTIQTASGRATFLVELARTPAQQERGLMYRRSLAAARGMLFPFVPPRPAAFWMKNTLIPLDLLFVRADGTIARIAANAVPGSLATIESGEPVAAVLEIAGGRAAATGMKEGDRVSWPGGPTR